MSSIKFTGLEAVLDELDEVADTGALTKAIKDSCAIVERAARTKAPKGEGDLRRSITSKVERDSNEIKGTIFTPLEYAPYVEYGTGLFAEKGGGSGGWWVYVAESSGKSGLSRSSKRYTQEKAEEIVAQMREKGIEAYCTQGMEATPYMRPALKENRDIITSKLKEALNNG